MPCFDKPVATTIIDPLQKTIVTVVTSGLFGNFNVFACAMTPRCLMALGSCAGIPPARLIDVPLQSGEHALHLFKAFAAVEDPAAFGAEGYEELNIYTFEGVPQDRAPVQEAKEAGGFSGADHDHDAWSSVGETPGVFLEPDTVEDGTPRKRFFELDIAHVENAWRGDPAILAELGLSDKLAQYNLVESAARIFITVCDDLAREARVQAPDA